MMKTMVLCALMASAAAGFAQESRQDVSLSAIGALSPQVNGNAVQVNPRKFAALGFLGSYRYMLTPRSALELNYTFDQSTTHYRGSSYDYNVHFRQQELSGAYVYSLTFGNFIPFAEAGVGAIIFSPIKDFGTTTLDLKQNTNIGGLFGAGVAYELSPSFDIRAEYRGFIAKTPDFGLDRLKTNRYQVVSTPSIGIAYHF
jgi:opacity protein-like surface antigen